MIAAVLIALVGVVLAVAVVTGGFVREDPVRYFDAPGYEESSASTEAP